MVIRTGLSSQAAQISRAFTSGGSPAAPVFQLGKVFGVVTGENEPTPELFRKAGGFAGLGTVYYLNYETSKNTKPEEVNLNECLPAISLDSNIKNYPLVEEIILLIDGPSPKSQVFAGAGQKYYIGPFNVWNNPQFNAVVSTENARKYFTETSDIRPLNPFEGDIIIQGRRGNGLRFSSTVTSSLNILNEWSNIGNNGDPITILTNGYTIKDVFNYTPNTEEINMEMSSIYMTSTQQLPLFPGTDIINPVRSPTAPDAYSDGSQIILNSDRITINSKMDEILLYSSKDTDLNSDLSINLNAKKSIHLHIDHNNPDSKISLGTKENGTIPSEPVLLGNQTHDVLLEMCNALTVLAGFLSSVTVPTTEGGVLVTGCNLAGENLLTDIGKIVKKLETITSNKVYTV